MSAGQREARGDADWRLLYRAGGLAAWFSALLVPVAIASHLVWPPPPWAAGAAADWFTYIQDNPVAGLLNLDLGLEIGLVVSVPLFLAVIIALRETNRSLLLIAVSVALLGAVMHLISNTSLEMLMLSRAHVAATTDAQRTVFLAAGEARLSAYYGMVFQVSYVLGYLAYILIGMAMRRGEVFSRATANLAVATGIVGFGFYLPGIGLLLSVLVVLLIAVWNVMVGRRLLQLGRPSRTQIS